MTPRCVSLVQLRFSRLPLAAILAFGLSASADQAPLGRRIDDFSLGDTRGKSYSLVEGPAKATVVAFMGTECPLANVYAPRIDRLAQKWREKGVRFLMIMPNQQDSLAEIGEFVKKHGLATPVVKDPGARVADLFSAERTPEVFVLDGDRTIRYAGRVDDQWGIGYQRKEAPRQDLDLAIEQIVAGKPIETPRTKAQGCLIGRVKKPVGSASITFHKDVVPLLQRRCVECHHEGQVAPFSLIDYQEVTGWAEMIREVVSERRMPPWFADRAHGKFSNDPSLTEAEKKIFFDWIDAGCPEGNPADSPPPLKLAKGWAIDGPDQVFYMANEPYVVPAEGTVAYRYYVVDPGFTEDHWISQAEVKAGNPAVVHHVIVFIESPGRPGFGQPQMAYAPGMSPRHLPTGYAIRIPAGARLRFQVHYTPNGVEQSDRSYVGFKYADPKDVTHEVIGGAAGVMVFAIPPGDPNYKMVATETLSRDTTMIGMNPHMHVRGKSFKFEARYPDGRTEILLDVPKYDFNWQLWYNLAEPKILPKGTVLRCTAYFDNSPDNPNNPNPKQRVTWGEQTWDEMMFGFYSKVIPRDDRSVRRGPSNKKNPKAPANS